MVREKGEIQPIEMIRNPIISKLRNRLNRRFKIFNPVFKRQHFKIKNSKHIANPDILLVFCPPWDVYMPPLGISYLASNLAKFNFKVLIFDVNIQLFNKSDANDRELWRPEKYDLWVDEKLFVDLEKKFKEHIESAAWEIIHTNARVIGFSVHMSNRRFTIALINELKKWARDKIIILGGYGCSNEQMRSEVPESLADIFVIGEGEETIVEIVSRIKDSIKLENINGAIITKEYRRFDLIPRMPVQDLNTLAYPTYKEYLLEDYMDPTLPILLSRGCIGRCAFCNDYVLARPYRTRSAQNVFEEILYHIGNNGITSFSFKDLLCNGNIRNLEELCDLIIAKGLHLTWDSQAIPKKDMSLELLTKMKKAGCHTLIYGIESFSNRVLKRMRKYFEAEDAIEVLKLTKKTGIRTLINIIVGFPGERDEDFMLTYNAIKINESYIDMFSSLNTCCVNADSDLDRYHKNYNIVLPENPFERALKWYTLDGNTYELRKERALRILSLLDELGISYMCTNAKDQNQSIAWNRRDSLKSILQK